MFVCSALISTSSGVAPELFAEYYESILPSYKNYLERFLTFFNYFHWRQTGLKSGGAEWEFETYLVKIRDLFSNTRLRDQKNSRCT